MGVLQDVAVLFSETLSRALGLGFISREQIDECDPSVMITLPRLAIVAFAFPCPPPPPEYDGDDCRGLLIFQEGPLSLDKQADSMPDMFRPFQALLKKIRYPLLFFAIILVDLAC